MTNLSMRNPRFIFDNVNCCEKRKHVDAFPFIAVCKLGRDEEEKEKKKDERNIGLNVQ